MNAREKFKAVLNFEPGAPAPKVETSYWYQCVEGFIDQGLPVVSPLPATNTKNIVVRGGPVAIPKGNDDFYDKNVMSFFNMDPYFAKFPFDISPQQPKVIIRDEEASIVYKDSFGREVYEKKTDNTTNYVLKYPVETLVDFNKYKELYNTNYAERLPKNWAQLVEGWRSRDYPIRLGGNPFGCYGIVRVLMGDENAMIAMYEEPELIHAIERFYVDLIKNYWSLFLKEVEMDCVMIWEDISYNAGAMISNAMFHEFFTPYYVELIDFFHQYGLNHIIVDSDGFVEGILPEFVNAGATGMYPFEIYAGNDLLRIREAFPKLQILGGINKRVLMTPQQNFAAIDQELEKVPVLLRQGGFIPHVDHSVPEGTTLENFTYYRNRLNEIIDRETRI